MPFTLTHGLIAFILIAFFTKDKRLWIVAFWAGMMPDLDGLPILFDLDLFYAIHHELLHPLIYGIIFGLIFAFALQKLLKMDFKKVFIVFAVSYMLHPLTDVIFTDWGVKLLWPFIQDMHSWPIFIVYNLELAVVVMALSILILLKSFDGQLRQLVSQNK